MYNCSLLGHYATNCGKKITTTCCVITQKSVVLSHFAAEVLITQILCIIYYSETSRALSISWRVSGAAIQLLLNSFKKVFATNGASSQLQCRTLQRLGILTANYLFYETMERPPLWSSGQSFWLQIQRSRVRFPALPDFLSSSGSGTGSTTQPREVNWGATWKKK